MAPKVQSVAVVKGNATKFSPVSTVSIDNKKDFSVASLTTGLDSSYNIVVTDQYGVKTLATTATGAVTFPDTTSVGQPNVTIIPVKGTLNITNNGTKSATVKSDSLTSGTEFDVKLTYAGGATTTVHVVVQ